MEKLKLDTRRTVLVGMAFLSIMAFWQMYDNVIQLILDKTFHMDETLSGVIMSADNVLALFLLPLFGGLSDRTPMGRLGRRTPYILGGTLVAVALMNLLPVIDNSYFAAPSPLKTVAFVVVLGLLLISMGVYRSPAVALMPDVTPKPLRSRANAIINLMGTVGGLMFLVSSMVLYPKSRVDGVEHVNYLPIFLIVSGIMLLAVAILLIFVREPKLARENQELEKKHPEWNLAEDDGTGHETLPKPVKRSLMFLLASIALWYMGYNGVTTWFSRYIAHTMGEGLGDTSSYLTVATAGAIVSYIPIGLVASKIGRKRTILGGVALLAACFMGGFVLTSLFHTVNIPMYICFALVGLAWAAINVNSLPMVVEMCRGSDIGKFTGFYYTASMLAQVITPILAGTLIKHISYHVLFPYAALFTALSFVTMLFVKHGDVKATAKRGLEAYEDMDD